MVPSSVTILFLALYGETGDWGSWSNIWLGLAAICGVAGGINLVLYVYAHAGQVIVDLRQAEFSTPEVRMFEAAKGMHPDAVRFLLTQRRTIWRIKYVAQADLVDWVLDDAVSVHVGFVEFVLDHSSSDALMPISMLSEGAYLFDPDKLISDRQQYRDLLMLLQQKLMVTQAFGNQSAKWISPWGPGTVRRRMGLEDDGSAELPAEALGRTGERAEVWMGHDDPLLDLQKTEWLKKMNEEKR
jgi:hypothetical protein